MTLRLISAWSRSGKPMVRNRSPTVIWLEKSLMNSNVPCSTMRSSERSAISSVGSTSRSRLRLRNAAWLKARSRSCRGGSVVPSVAPARPGKFVDHVALGRGERLPVARRLHDVVVTRQDPELRAFAPVAGMFFAQLRVIRKRVGIDRGE